MRDLIEEEKLVGIQECSAKGVEAVLPNRDYGGIELGSRGRAAESEQEAPSHLDIRIVTGFLVQAFREALSLLEHEPAVQQVQGLQRSGRNIAAGHGLRASGQSNAPNVGSCC